MPVRARLRTFVLALATAAAGELAMQQPVLAAPEAWTGSIRVAGAAVYDAPGGALVATLDAGSPVTVWDWQYGPALTMDNYTWASIGGGRFVHSSVLRHAPLSDAPPAPPRIVSPGHWADVNLTQQILTLYEANRPVRTALMNSGRPGQDTESHQGEWDIVSRVADETMRGSGYDISGVLFTQYFTPDAEAIHLNYWLTDDERGIPRSHGCLGLAYADAAFAWRFLELGSKVFVHA